MSQDLGQQQHPHTGLGHGRVEAIATVASIVGAWDSLNVYSPAFDRLRLLSQHWTAWMTLRADAFGSLGAGVMQYLVGRLVTCKTDGNDRQVFLSGLETGNIPCVTVLTCVRTVWHTLRRITSCDWRGVLITLAALTTVGGLCLSRMLIREAREPARRYSQ